MPPDGEDVPMRRLDGTDLIHLIENIDGIKWMPRPVGNVDGISVVARSCRFSDHWCVLEFIEMNKHQISICGYSKGLRYWSGKNELTGEDEWNAWLPILRYAKKPGTELIYTEGML